MTALVEHPVTENIKDFSLAKPFIKFRVDQDVFEAAPEIAAELVVKFAQEAELLDPDKTSAADLVTVIRNLLTAVMVEESSRRLLARLSDSTNPIGIERLIEIIEWLLEQYGLRPTESDSDSSVGAPSPAAGTNSTVSVYAAASTFDD